MSILLADPITVETVAYRPLLSHTALGLSALYIALLITFCGFLGGIIVNVSADTVLGYAATEIGPRWSQRQPVAISRWQTLPAKWAMAVPLMLVLTGLMLLAAVGVLDMNTPRRHADLRLSRPGVVRRNGPDRGAVWLLQVPGRVRAPAPDPLWNASGARAWRVLSNAARPDEVRGSRVRDYREQTAQRAASSADQSTTSGRLKT